MSSTVMVRRISQSQVIPERLQAFLVVCLLSFTNRACLYPSSPPIIQNISRFYDAAPLLYALSDRPTVLGHRMFPLFTGGVIPVLAKAETVPQQPPNTKLEAFAPACICAQPPAISIWY